MKILDDVISTLDFEAPVRDIRQGVFHSGVLTRHCGLAATLSKDAFRQTPPLSRAPGTLLERSSFQLAEMAYSDLILEAAIGMAAINSLLEVKLESCLELNAADLIAEKGVGKRVAIVGHFPFIPRIRKKAKALWVLEKNPKEGDYDEADAEKVIPAADVVALTGTTFTNHTLEQLLRLRNPTAFLVMLGDTTPLSPVLFDHGIDAISGTRVVDSRLALSCVSEGANFRQIGGVKRLTMMK